MIRLRIAGADWRRWRRGFFSEDDRNWAQRQLHQIETMIDVHPLSHHSLLSLILPGLINAGTLVADFSFHDAFNPSFGVMESNHWIGCATTPQ